MGGIWNLHPNIITYNIFSFLAQHHIINIMASTKDIVYVILVMYVACTAIAVILEPLATDLPCDEADDGDAASPNGTSSFPNVLFVYRPCRYRDRHPMLMGLTRRECRFGRHMVISAFLGGVIGYERRSADRPAGIRTMSVVSLSACLFTINSTFAFMLGPMHWDPGEYNIIYPTELSLPLSLSLGRRKERGGGGNMRAPLTPIKAVFLEETTADDRWGGTLLFIYSVQRSRPSLDFFPGSRRGTKFP